MSDEKQKFNFAVKTTLTDEPVRYAVDFSDMDDTGNDIDDELSELQTFLEDHSQDGVVLDLEYMHDRAAEFCAAYKVAKIDVNDGHLDDVLIALFGLYKARWRGHSAARGMYYIIENETADGWETHYTILDEDRPYEEELVVHDDATAFLKSTMNAGSNNDDERDAKRWSQFQRMMQALNAPPEVMASTLAYLTVPYGGKHYYVRPALADELSCA